MVHSQEMVTGFRNVRALKNTCLTKSPVVVDGIGCPSQRVSSVPDTPCMEVFGMNRLIVSFQHSSAAALGTRPA